MLKEKTELVGGIKQTKKIVKLGNAKTVYIARDAESHVVSQLEALCKNANIKIIYINSMKELSKMCGIKVNTSAAAILKVGDNV